MLTSLLPHVCFFHFSDACNLGSNGSIKFLESMLSFIPIQRADPTLFPKCYDGITDPILGKLPQGKWPSPVVLTWNAYSMTHLETYFPMH